MVVTQRIDTFVEEGKNSLFRVWNMTQYMLCCRLNDLQEKMHFWKNIHVVGVPTRL